MTVHCESCDLNWDDDEHDDCPVCEARKAAEQAHWLQLWKGERQAGLIGDRDDAEPVADPRTPEYWGLR